MAAVAFLGLTVLLLLSLRREWPAYGLLAASVATLVWAVVSIMSAYAPPWSALVSPAETLRSGAWIAFLVILMWPHWRLAERVSYSFVLSLVIWFVFAFLLLLDIVAIFGLLPSESAAIAKVIEAFMAGRLISSIGGLALVENLYRSTASDSRWQIRPLCIGLGALFVFDIFMYAEGTLFRAINPALLDARGALFALGMPLIALSAARNPGWKSDIQVSQRAVFHTVSLVATGIYLLAMSAAGLYLKEFGGQWGELLQITFVFLALVALVFFAMSGRARAWLRVVLAKNLFTHKYDYRAEWLRFIRTLSTSDSGEALERRVIKAVGDLLDSPGGILWLPDEQGTYLPVERWNFPKAPQGEEPPESPFIAFLDSRQWIVNFNEIRQGSMVYGDLALPVWAQGDERCWVAVPLIHHDILIGFMVMEQPRAARALNWEDHDLLKTVGRQVASYLAERQSQDALAQAAEFDAFNRRFAFIMHDLKNLVSQLSLLARNAERHLDNPAFRADMLATLRASVERMNKMLATLHRQVEPVRHGEAIDLSAVLGAVFRAKQPYWPELRLVADDATLRVRGNREGLEQVFSHLVQNAIEASKEGQAIEIRATPNGRLVEVAVCDNGCGMSQEFISNDLFKPFRSTKSEGFGIGAFECRELIRAMGGQLAVRSAVGQGTSMVVTLRAAEDDEADRG
ncbi:MAG: XrtA/PEP-CTERM system histidine kinase PrsK [Pseudomonadota bacterium]